MLADVASARRRKLINVGIPLLIAFVLSVCSVAWLGGGVLHPECETRLPYFLSDRPLLSKLYDSNVLDWNMYQARELSYFFDYVDCKFIQLCILLGLPHFLSLTHYLFLGLISLGIWRFGSKELKLSRRILVCVLLMLWTTPSTFLGGYYFRSAKIGVALAMVMLYSEIYGIVSPGDDGKFRAKDWLIVFGWSWAATLFDRQGVFLVAVVIACVTVWYCAFRNRMTLQVLSALGAAFALSFLYNYVIAPLLALVLNGYWPDFRYQRLPWESIIQTPFYYFGSGVSLFVETIRFLFGNVPSFAGVAILVIMIISGCMLPSMEDDVSRRKRVMTTVAGLVLSMVLIAGMFGLMVSKHPQIMWEDVRRVYYWLPAIVLLCMTLLLLLAQLGQVVPKWFFLGVLLAAVGSNILAIPQHDRVLRQGHLREYFELAPGLLAALKELPAAKKEIPPEIAQNQVYIYFRKSCSAPN